MGRYAAIERNTAETQITVTIELDGTGRSEIDTGVGFLDHMLTSFAKHGLMDLSVKCIGDLPTGSHHTIEDVGIALGTAIGQALGDKKGITRFGTCHVPMDEALVRASLDVSGRPYLVFTTQMDPAMHIGNYEVETTEDFFRALAFGAGITLHVTQLDGKNAHHIIEAAFKATARALDQACMLDPRVTGVPSTKGVL